MNDNRGHNRIGRTVLAVATIALLAAVALTAQPPGSSSQSPASRRQGAVPPDLGPDQTFPGVPWFGDLGTTETVGEIVARERAQPKTALRMREARRVGRFNGPRRDNPDARAVDRWPPPLRIGSADVAAPAIGFNLTTSFLGARFSESGAVPPDSNGAVGPTQVMVTVNGRFKLFDKAGNLQGLNVSDFTFFNSVVTPGPNNFISDPHIRFDRLSGRWFITEIDVPEPCECSNRVLIAVSSGPTITNSSSFTFFQFQHDLVAPTPNPDTGNFADYDTLGVDANALYIGVNEFSGTTGNFLHTDGFVVNKANLLSGILTVTAFRQLTNPTTFVGPVTPQGVVNDDPSATEGYFIGVDGNVFSRLDIRRVTNPGGTPSISGNLALTVPTTFFPIDQVAQGSTRPLDALDDRLYGAIIEKNKITGVSSLWTAHNMRVNSSGVAGSGGDRNGARWYQIDNLTTTPTLTQSGTLFDSAGSNPNGNWIPTIAANGQGHAVIANSFAGTNNPPSVAIANRLSSDPLGTMPQTGFLVAGVAGYNIQTSGTQRWGDYSAVAVDPTDDMTMWTFQELCDATNSWGVQVVKLLAPPPATPASASPAAVDTGLASTTITITGTSSAGSGFFDPGSGFANRLTASVSGGVTVNSATFIDPTHVSLNISTLGATAGVKNVTITNPDGQSLVGTGILTVNQANQPPTISAIANRETPKNTAVGVSFTVGDVESGAAAVTVSAVSSNMVLVPNGNLLQGGAGANRTLTVTPAANQTGTTTITVTASDGSQMTTTAFAVVVGRRPQGDLDGDRQADVLWRNKVDGQNVFWLLGGTTVRGTGFLPQVSDVNWEVKGRPDFDGDGQADVFWRNKVTGENVIWLISNAGIAEAAFTLTVSDFNWELQGFGDFDGDGQADVFWRNKVTGENVIWFMTGLTFKAAIFLAQVADVNWEIKAIGDLDGDGQADVFWRNKVTGATVIWLISGGGIAGFAVSATMADVNWEIKGVGDLDGDGRADILWRNKTTGQNVIWFMNGTAIRTVTFAPTVADLTWEIRMVADVNGDGRADLVWRNNVTGANIVWLLDGATIIGAAFLPTVNDLNWMIIGP